MTLELIAFITSIIFGVLWYWRESKGNKIYRFLNRLMNAKKLQMKPTDRTGFVFEQSFLLRFVFISLFFLVVILLVKFLIPIDYATISMFASSIVGTLIGTYLAGLIFKSRDIIKDNSDAVEDKLHDTVEKGKDFIEDVFSRDKVADNDDPIKEDKPDDDGKSGRDRLKDKGLL